MIFETSKQHTWLVATSLYTYVLLDDVETRTKNRMVQTFFDNSKILALEIRDSQKNKRARVVKFAAQDTFWFYSKKLFPTKQSLTNATHKLLGDSPANFKK